MRRSSAVFVAVLAIAGCSKSSSEKGEGGSATPTAGSARATATIDASAPEPAEPTEAATVVGPTRSATGALEIGGAITGTFEWKKKDQKSPITCVWDAAKEIGTVRVDVSDGAGKLISVGVDVPPLDAGMPRLDVSSKDLAAPLEGSLGFNVSGETTDEATVITVKLDAKLGEDEKKPDLTIKGTLEVTCPRRK